MDNSKKTGAAGGKDKALDEVDLMILEILEKDSPQVCGLGLPESQQADNQESHSSLSTGIENEELANVSTASGTGVLPASKSSRRKRASGSSRHFDDHEKRLKLELLKVEVYHRKLQCLKLERDLQLPPSEFTRGIAENTLFTDQIRIVHVEEDEPEGNSSHS